MTFDQWLSSVDTNKVTLRDAWEAAQAQEREDCAKVCDGLQSVPATEPRHCAEDIRGRSFA